MAYICQQCGNIYVENPQMSTMEWCPNFECSGGELIQIDEMLLPIIRKFWKNDYRTRYCCAGHDHDTKKKNVRSSMYIDFDVLENNMDPFKMIQSMSESYSNITPMKIECFPCQNLGNDEKREPSLAYRWDYTDYANHLEILSWLATVELDCPYRRFDTADPEKYWSYWIEKTKFKDAIPKAVFTLYSPLDIFNFRPRCIEFDITIDNSNNEAIISFGPYDRSAILELSTFRYKKAYTDIEDIYSDYGKLLEYIEGSCGPIKVGHFLKIMNWKEEE